MIRLLSLICLLLAGVSGQAAAQTITQPIAVSATTSFAGGCVAASPCTVAGVLSATPCSATYLAQYAIVSDLYSNSSNTNEVMRCGLTGSSYYWRPQRTDFVASTTSTGGTKTLTCLVDAPTQFLSGTLASNLTVNMVTTNCWPGAEFDVANDATLGIFGVTLGNLIGSTTKSLGLNSRVTVRFDGTSWKAF